MQLVVTIERFEIFRPASLVLLGILGGERCHGKGWKLGTPDFTLGLGPRNLCAKIFDLAALLGIGRFAAGGWRRQWLA